MVGPGVPGSAAGALGRSLVDDALLEELHAAAEAAITGSGLPHVAAKATEAAAPEAAEASTTAARRMATGRRTPTRLRARPLA